MYIHSRYFQWPMNSMDLSFSLKFCHVTLLVHHVTHFAMTDCPVAPSTFPLSPSSHHPSPPLPPPPPLSHTLLPTSTPPPPPLHSGLEEVCQDSLYREDADRISPSPSSSPSPPSPPPPPPPPSPLPNQRCQWVSGVSSSPWQTPESSAGLTATIPRLTCQQWTNTRLTPVL